LACIEKQNLKTTGCFCFRISEAKALKSSAGSTLGRVKLAQVKEKKLGFGQKPDYFQVLACIQQVNHDRERVPWYTSCPQAGCKKKVRKPSVSLLLSLAYTPTLLIIIPRSPTLSTILPRPVNYPSPLTDHLLKLLVETKGDKG